MTVQYYYDLTPTKQHTSDTEGNLVQLCTDCAEPLLHAKEIELAQRGDADSVCEQCNMTNNVTDEQE